MIAIGKSALGSISKSIRTPVHVTVFSARTSRTNRTTKAKSRDRMTRMTPAEYVMKSFRPPSKNFRDDRRSRRRAYLGLVSLSITSKIILKRRVKWASAGKCPDTFELVRSICNGSKHVETDHTHEIQFQAGSDWDRPPAFAEVTRTGISYLGDVFGGREARVSRRP